MSESDIIKLRPKQESYVERENKRSKLMIAGSIMLGAIVAWAIFKDAGKGMEI